LGPLLHEIQIKVAFQDNNSTAIEAFKQALQDDMDSRYTDPNIKFLMHKASFLDPRFKTLMRLSSTAKQEVFWKIF